VPVPVATRAPGGETNAYRVGDLLVDPAARTDRLDDVVGAGADADAGASASVAHVAVTHAHPDHVGAVAAYADATDATVWARAGHGDRFVDAAGVEPDRTFADGDAVGPARALATPGHAPDHVCFVVDDATGPGVGRPVPGADDAGDGADAASGATVALCGDLAVATGSVAVAHPEGDLAAYLDSLRRLRETGATRAYPGHGPPIEDTAATVDRLTAHRADRERRVLAAVADGARDVDAVLAGAYDKDLTGVEDLARATVRAHLIKLDAEGRVRFDVGDDAVRPAAE
jgi:glyoxylase-like metal-dependent hydrolase (beta-lactamase superfamily II)